MLGHLWFVTFFEVFDVYLAQDVAGFVVAVLKEEMGFHVLLLEESNGCAVFWGLDTLIPLLINGGVLQSLRHSPRRQFPQKRIRVENLSLE